MVLRYRALDRASRSSATIRMSEMGWGADDMVLPIDLRWGGGGPKG